ncbi:hypothetical protein [Otariodibacter oris]|uniref:Uncharacterized protein n=1 Tax=Otariodibacter oris TaxID=1032623 RepID=A0A420XI16_9PAST|nr:hypothetical protein [Otariodibacter oris]QGM80844.1 hypothetical protein A6A10_05220 [Otariodibacter oris]RKR76985.1 hypothetical protein DES31_0298 [Otariodibacter oris]
MKLVNSKKFFFALFIILGINLYGLVSGDLFNRNSIEKETRHIYNAITEEIELMNGKYEQFGGRVNSGFILKSDFLQSHRYDKENIIKKIEKLGFTIDEKKSQDNSYVFCKGESGFLVSGDRELTIDYNYKMFYCSN